MPFLALPILAQLLVLGAEDRAEVRSITSSSDKYAEAEERASAAAGLVWRHALVRVDPSASLVLTPLGNPTPLLLQSTTGTVSFFGEQPRMRYSVTETGGYAVRNLRNEFLSSPAAATPGGTSSTPPAANGATPPPATGGGTQPTTTPPPGGAALTLPAASQTTTFWSQSTTAILGNDFSRRLTLETRLGYEANGGLDEASRRDVPTLHQPSADLTLHDRLAARSDLASGVSGLVAIGSNGTRSMMVRGFERLVHQFSRRTTGAIGAGVAYTHIEARGNLSHSEVDPTGEASVVDRSRVALGDLSAFLGVSYEPVLDRLTVTIAPRTEVEGGVSWGNDTVTLTASGGVTFPTYPHRMGSLSSRSANATLAYLFGSGFSAETGARLVSQTYASAPTLPPTLLVFGALQWRGAMER